MSEIISIRKNPQISVVMAIFNEPIEWIRISLDSILRQTFRDFELIIVNDNPLRIENSITLEEYEKKDSRVVVITNKENMGLTKSLNRGLEIAKGEYIARMDADDISMPSRFEEQYSFMEKNPDVDVCGSFIKVFGKVSLFTSKLKKFPELHKNIVATLIFENSIAHPSVMMRRCVNNWNIRYNEMVNKAQDYYLWYDLNRINATFHNLQSSFLNYRISNTQISSVASSHQFSTADIIHKCLLEYIGITNPLDIDIHNEICRLKKNKYTLDEKQKYLIRLYNLIKKTQDIDAYIFIIKKYSMLTCLVHEKPKDVYNFPYINNSDVFSIWFTIELMKLLIVKVKKFVSCAF